MRNTIDFLDNYMLLLWHPVYLKFTLVIWFFVSDGELEAQWLVSAGFPHLTKAFEEVSDR